MNYANFAAWSSLLLVAGFAVGRWTIVHPATMFTQLAVYLVGAIVVRAIVWRHRRIARAIRRRQDAQLKAWRP